VNIYDKLSRVVVFLLAMAGLLAIVIWYLPVIKDNERLRTTKLELDRKIDKEMETARKLDAAMRSLQDPRTVERLARERLSYAKPGETVIHFEAPPTNAPARY
jgi:cell division protein FtsB